MQLQAICVKDGAELFKNADVGLCYYKAEADDYVGVQCTLEYDSAGSLLMMVVSFALAPHVQCSHGHKFLFCCTQQQSDPADGLCTISPVNHES